MRRETESHIINFTTFRSQSSLRMQLVNNLMYMCSKPPSHRKKRGLAADYC